MRVLGKSDEERFRIHGQPGLNRAFIADEILFGLADSGSEGGGVFLIEIKDFNQKIVLMVLLSSLLVDILTAVLDPRVKLS